MAFWNKDNAANAPQHPQVGRNDPCHCGSGKKYKKCCMAKDEAAEHKVLEENWSKAEAQAKVEAENQAKEAKEGKDSKSSSAAPVKHAGPQHSTKQQHPTFIPNQVSAPRKSGGG
jgi:hypothetical protein